MIVLHWLSGFLLLALLAVGWLMVHAQYEAAARFDIYQLHKSLGFAALALLVVRGIVRASTTAPAVRADARVGATLGERSASRPVPALVDLDFVGLARRLICDRGRAQPFLRFFRHSQHPRRQRRAIRVRAIAALNVSLGSGCADISPCLRGPETPIRRWRRCFDPYVAVLSQSPVTSPGFLIVRTPVESYERPWSQRRSATNDQTPSTRPNGHAPSKKP